MLALALALVGASVAIHVESAEDLTATELSVLTASIAASIGARTGAAPVIDTASGCKAADRCLADIRARTGKTEIVYLNLTAVLTRIRIAAERRSDGDLRESTIDASRDGSDLAMVADSVAASLFPEYVPPKLVAEPPPPEIIRVVEAAPVSPWGYILFSASGALIAASIGTGLRGMVLRNQATAEPPAGESFEPGAAGQARTFFWSSWITGALGAATAGLGTWLVLAD